MADLFSRRKITILKAIHNWIVLSVSFSLPVFAPKNYNFESNSQLYNDNFDINKSCFRAEKLQFWKQFTTLLLRVSFIVSCFRAEKLQFWKQFTTIMPNYRKAVIQDKKSANIFQSHFETFVSLTFRTDFGYFQGIPQKLQNPNSLWVKVLKFCYSRLAEREGFEPPVVLPTSVFKTGALNRSAISPWRHKSRKKFFPHNRAK